MAALEETEQADGVTAASVLYLRELELKLMYQRERELRQSKKETMNKTETAHLFNSASHQLAAAAHLMEVGRVEEAKTAAHSGIAGATFAIDMAPGPVFQTPQKTPCTFCDGTGKR